MILCVRGTIHHGSDFIMKSDYQSVARWENQDEQGPRGKGPFTCRSPVPGCLLNNRLRNSHPRNAGHTLSQPVPRNPGSAEDRYTVSPWIQYPLCMQCRIHKTTTPCFNIRISAVLICSWLEPQLFLARCSITSSISLELSHEASALMSAHNSLHLPRKTAR